MCEPLIITLRNVRGFDDRTAAEIIDSVRVALDRNEILLAADSLQARACLDHVAIDPYAQLPPRELRT